VLPRQKNEFHPAVGTPGAGAEREELLKPMTFIPSICVSMV